LLDPLLVIGHTSMALVREVGNASAVGGTPENDVDFCLVRGGPLYQLYLRSAKPTPGSFGRRIIGLSLVCWLPALMLSFFGRTASGGVPLPFLLDVDGNVRFLVVLPLLIWAEVVAHRRIPTIVGQFLERDIITAEDRPRFEDLIASVTRLRNSVLIEVLLIICAFGGYWMWREYLTLGVSSWYAVNMGGVTHLTAAGYWYVLISLPILRFLIFRWYFRLFLWYWFLWHVRRLSLHLNFLHPDCAGGLGFLSGSVFAFAPVLIAQTTLLAGMIGNSIWHAGAALPSFKMEIATVVGFLMLLVLTPLGFFLAQLDRAGRGAKREYGILASRYVDDFYGKWIDKQGASTGQPLLGTSDIQSLADLSNAYGVVSKMRLVPVSKDTVIRLMILLFIPLLPLVLTMIRLEQVIDRLLKLVW
jgi:hypothetical protein